MKKRTQQEWHNEFVEFWNDSALHSVKDAIKFYKQVIENCNYAYYNSEIQSRLTDAEYDDICQQYVALNKIIGIEVELTSCRFFGMEEK